MIHIDDITGWREELAEYRESQEGQAFFLMFGPGGTEKVPTLPREIPLRLAEMLLEFPELRSAVQQTVQWERVLEEFPDMHPGHPEYHRSPTSAYKTIRRFVDWYAMKVQEAYWSMSWFGCALRLAEMVESGKIEAVRSDAALSFIKQNYSRTFS